MGGRKSGLCRTLASGDGWVGHKFDVCDFPVRREIVVSVMDNCKEVHIVKEAIRFKGTAL